LVLYTQVISWRAILLTSPPFLTILVKKMLWALSQVMRRVSGVIECGRISILWGLVAVNLTCAVFYWVIILITLMLCRLVAFVFKLAMFYGNLLLLKSELGQSACCYTSHLGAHRIFPAVRIRLIGEFNSMIVF
jgi:hypothetical protein